MSNYEQWSDTAALDRIGDMKKRIKHLLEHIQDTTLHEELHMATVYVGRVEVALAGGKKTIDQNQFDIKTERKER